MKSLVVALCVAVSIPHRLIAGQTPIRDSIGRAIVDVVPQQVTNANAPKRRPGMFWTGVALVAVGALFVVDGIVVGGEPDQCLVVNSASGCLSSSDVANAAIGVGIGVAVLGGILAAVGGRRESPPPLAVAAPLAVAPPLSSSSMIVAYTDCVLARTDRLLQGAASASDIADAALADCSQEYDRLRQASPSGAAETRDDVRRTAISRVLRAREPGRQ